MNTDSLFDKYYYSRTGFISGTTEFHRLCASYVPLGGRVLEIGSGPGNATSEFLASLGRLVGVDISDEVLRNPFLTEARVYDGRRLPFDSNSFQACVADYVIEHVTNPEEHFSEVARVLHPGGVYCFRTPNVWHYLTAASKIMPYGLHVRLANPLRCLESGAHDPYPTVYRANTRARILQLSRTAGMLPKVLRTIEKEPSYARASKIFFYPMMAYERLVNSSTVFDGIRVNILGALQKSTAHEAVRS